MNDTEVQRTAVMGEIAARHRQATELCIAVKLEALETEDERILEEAAKDLEHAVHELEHARRVLVESHQVRVWGPDPRDFYASVFG